MKTQSTIWVIAVIEGGELSELTARGSAEETVEFLNARLVDDENDAGFEVWELEKFELGLHVDVTISADVTIVIKKL